jgi:hypothetical protein
MSISEKYQAGRGFMSRRNASVMRYQDAVGRGAPGGGMLGWGTMRNSMTGSMDARWGGATTGFDWRHAGPSLVSPRAMEKAPKGRPKAPKAKPEDESGPQYPGLTYTESPRPISNQSYGDDAPRVEFSTLPSDQSKSGMGEDSPVWSAGAEPKGYAGDAQRPAGYSAALPAHPLGTSLPWAPGRGVGSPAKPSVYPASFLPRGNSFDRTNDAGVWPSSDAATGGINDSSIYPSSGTAGGSDSSIYPSTMDKGDIGGKQDSTRRRAGMNQVALNQIGVVRRNGGWPGA